MIITDKEINLAQLDAELGSYGLVADFNDPLAKIIGVAEGSPVTNKQLSDAIDKHVAGPTDEQIKIFNREEGISKLKQLGFTDEQIQALLS